MQLEGIHHIALNVGDLDRAEKFYTDVLGFKVSQRFSTGLRHIMLDTGNSAIALFESPDLETKEATDHLSDTGYMHFAFKAGPEQFKSLVEEFAAKKVKIDNGPVKRGDGQSIYFTDPDNNHLEIHCDF